MIRQIRAEEWEQLKEIRLRALRTDPAAFGSTLAREEAFPDETWRARLASNATFVATMGDDWVGMSTLLDGPEPEIVGLWVAPEARRGGVAVALIHACIARAQGSGATKIHLWATVENDAALALYRRAGFAETGAPKDVDGGRRFQRLERRLG